MIDPLYSREDNSDSLRRNGWCIGNTLIAVLHRRQRFLLWLYWIPTLIWQQSTRVRKWSGWSLMSFFFTQITSFLWEPYFMSLLFSPFDIQLFLALYEFQPHSFLYQKRCLISGNIQSQVGWTPKATWPSGKWPCLWWGVGMRWSLRSLST